MRRRITIVSVAVAAVVAVTAGAAVAGFSFGMYRDRHLAGSSHLLFGVGKPLANSSTEQITQAEAQADPTKLVTLAKGLKAHLVTTQAPRSTTRSRCGRTTPTPRT